MIAPDPKSPTSGAQHEIRFGDHAAVITELGATLRSFTSNGHDVVDGFSVDEPSPAGRGQVLAPWPNRLEDGTYEFDGHEGHAELNEPGLRNAIHGLVRWLPWSVRRQSADAIELECTMEPQPAYPWELELRVEYALSGSGLHVTVEAKNGSTDVAPFGIGFHPYLTVGTEVVDEAVLTVPASRRLLMNERELPTGAVDVDGTDVDFMQPRVIGPTRMDTAFSDLRRDAGGRARVRLERTDGLRALDLWMEREFRYVMVYTGDAQESVERRRKAVAVEPMTCPPNAFHTGTDCIGLTPGVRWRAGWGIDPCPTTGTTS